MSDHASGPRGAEGDSASAFDSALALGRQQVQLLETARALVAQSRGLRAAAQDARLRREVTEYTRALRAGGEPPERALVRVKAAIVPALGGRPPDERRALLDAVVHWCVEAYYAA